MMNLQNKFLPFLMMKLMEEFKIFLLRDLH